MNIITTRLQTIACIVYLPLMISNPAAAQVVDAPADDQQSWYEGVPPLFHDATLNEYRDLYMHEKGHYDINPQAFLGADQPGKDCQLPTDLAQALAHNGYRPKISHRGPEPVEVNSDKVSIKVLSGDCSNNTLNGKASILIHMVHTGPTEMIKNPNDPNGPELKIMVINETTTRENCNYVDAVRDGFCTRYSSLKQWNARVANNGELLPLKEADLQDGYQQPTASHWIRHVITFDYGPFHEGHEVGPGVAFETIPVMIGKYPSVENTALVRTITPEGDIRYTEYKGEHPLRTFIKQHEDS